MDDFNFLHNSLVRLNTSDLFNVKNSFSVDYFSQVTFIFVGEDHRGLIDSSLNNDLKIDWGLMHVKSLEIFCRLREINNYSIFVFNVKNKDVIREITYLQEFKSKGHIFDLILVEGDISVQNLTLITKRENCRLLESSLDKSSLKNLISKIVESRKRELKELKERNLLINGHEWVNKDVRVPEMLYSKSFKEALNKCLTQFNENKGEALFIWGEKGVGKKKLAELTHLNSTKRENDLKIVNIKSIRKDYLDEYFFDREKGVLENEYLGTICLINLCLSSEESKSTLRNLLERKKPNVDLIIILEEKEKNRIEKKLDGGLKSVFLKSNIHLPSLRNRKDELKPLLEYYLLKYQKFHNNYFTVSKEILNSLKNYNWPGNLIELENLIEGVCATFDKRELKLEDLPQKYIKNFNKEEELEINFGDEGIDLNEYLRRLEMVLIKKALEKTNGNKNRASKLLNLNRTTLIEKMKKRNIDRNYPRIEN